MALEGLAMSAWRRSGARRSSCSSSSANGEDMYGFTVRPQHLEKYLAHDGVYKEEEVHRSSRWAQFLETHGSDENANEGREAAASLWGSLRVVEQAVQAGGACSWAAELKKLVWEGVPVSLRGELWQMFTGAKERWRDGYYQELLAGDAKVKWASQIEKDLPRTFPGHPVLAEDGLGSLRRMLTAYARHNPTVGYCQAMNFLAALLLLFMPEENAFWTLASIVDVYFEGYYTEKMTEAQVDQLVFTELVREQLPKLAKHLETVDVEISWISGAWFLSIFVNVLPWECVLRVWDVLLYDGNRSMLFRTALALLEMHAAPLLQLHDNGDVLSMLQSMGETTFDSSHLVLSACVGFQEIDEGRLERLRTRHRPTVIAEMHKRSLDVLQRCTANGSAGGIISQHEERSILELQSSDVEPHLNGLKGLTVGERGTLEYQLSLPKLFSYEADEFQDSQRSELQEEVSRLRKELDQALWAQEEAECRAEVLKHALTEMDQSRHSPVEMERLKAQVAHLKQALADKREQEAATIEVLVHLEQENRKADDARRRAIEESEENRQISAKALRRAAEDLEVMKQRAQAAELEVEAMEKRAVMAESMLQAVEQQAAEELRAMEKRALKAESMLQATLDFHSGSGRDTKREPSVDR